MNIQQFKRLAEKHGSKYFSDQNMKFFGDTLSNFKVTVLPDCYKLERIQGIEWLGNPDFMPPPTYFDKINLAQIFKSGTVF